MVAGEVLDLERTAGSHAPNVESPSAMQRGKKKNIFVLSNTVSRGVKSGFRL